MKSIIRTKLISCILLLFALVNANAQQAIAVDNTIVTSSCNLGLTGVPSDICSVGLVKEALTGDNVLLNITLPAIPTGCLTKLTILNSANLSFVYSGVIGGGTSGNTYTNTTLVPLNGVNFDVIYKFPNGTICNGENGTFTVTYETNCNGVIKKCVLNATVKARAANYWSITKSFVAGNLACGESLWYIDLTHNNPNTSTTNPGRGAYSVAATVTEAVLPPLQVVGTSTFTFNSMPMQGTQRQQVRLQNCQAVGTSITNTANYTFNFGNGCSTTTGTVTALSTALGAPAPNISFTKTAYSATYVWPNYIFSPGCQGLYAIQVSNNGNVPWNNLTITDNLTIPGISVTSINLPSGWTQTTPGGLTGLQTFTTTVTLNPGQSSYLYIYFNITGSAGTTVTNTANIAYTGGGSGSSGSSNSTCTGLNCPTSITSVQNKTATCPFVISTPVAAPRVVKCNEPDPFLTPIKQVGDVITFRIKVSNTGAGLFSGTITDNLTTSQNLSIVPSSLSFKYYGNQSNSLAECGFALPATVTTPPAGTTCTWNNNQTSPEFTMTIPGICSLYRVNLWVIEFDAVINPQQSGNKENIAAIKNTTLPTSKAEYIVSKVGRLQIRKTASVSSSTNGGTFNYILTVTNMGSTPLNNVIVTDTLPTCIKLSAPITISKGTSSVSYSTSIHQIIINPSISINPGESFVITIPVIKTSTGTCCNPKASATAKIEIDGQLINAITPINQPACVSDLSCCNIDGFSATLMNRPYGLSLILNGGPSKIQELEVSMLDYHVVYSNNLCKPVSMVAMGTTLGNIFSPHLTIGGLTNLNNNTNSIMWGLGTPTVVDTRVSLDITKADILALSCCTGTMYYCIKVKAKNVDCKTCEKILCGQIALQNQRDLTWGGIIDPIEEPWTPMPMQQSVQEPIQQSIQDPMRKLMPQSIQDPMQKLMPQSIQDPMQKLIPQSIQDPMQKLMPQSIQDPMQKLMPQSIQDPMQKLMPQSIQDPMQKLMPQSIQDPMQKLMPQSMQDPMPLSREQSMKVEEVLISEAIEQELKTLDPLKANEFLKRLSTTPTAVYEEMRAKINRPSDRVEPVQISVPQK